MPRSQSGLSVFTKNARCSHCNKLNERLKMCSACGAAAYCNRTCQKAAWKEHAPVCRATAASINAATNKGSHALLYDQHLGGLLSVVQRRMYLSKGAGVLVAKVSVPVADFRKGAGKRTDGTSRTISLAYLTGEQVEQLDQQYADEASTFNYKLLQQTVEACNTMWAGAPMMYPGLLYTLVILEEPHIKTKFLPKVVMIMIMNWLAPNHPAHGAFRNRFALSDDQLLACIFDWDTKDIILPLGSAAAKVPKTFPIVSDMFYQACMEMHEKEHCKDGPHCYTSAGYPPFAQAVAINGIPQK